jgi:hypothetical protein
MEIDGRHFVARMQNATALFTNFVEGGFSEVHIEDAA